ncbi:MAG: Maf family protein [Myxococcales bacterium]
MSFPFQRVVLGSASPRRREILVSLGVPFESYVVAVDERWLDGEEAGTYLERIAQAKLEAVQQTLPRELRERTAGILVADTSVVFKGEVLGKPSSPDHAQTMLRRLAGQTHEVHTRFALARTADGLVHAETVVTRVSFRALSEREVVRYGETGEGMDKAGGYAIQGRASAFAKRMEGSYTNVVGLPACEVAVALEKLGLGTA